MTAEEYIDKWNSHEGNFSDLRLSDLLILFAQDHVKAALKAAYANGQIKMREEVYEGRVWTSNEILESSIINAYPLEEIK